MPKLNVIIDTNYLFYKTLYIAKSYGKSDTIYLNTEAEISQFIRKVATDLVHDLKIFRGYHKVIFCKDSKSWRKNIYPEYKSNRKHDKDVIDWTKFFELMDEFLEIVSHKGVIISTIPYAEADDLVYFWSKYFFEHGESSVILTGDKDLTQLVNYNQDVFINVYNNNSTNNKMVVKTGFRDWIKNKQRPVLNIFELEELDTSQIIVNDASVLMKNLMNTELNFLEIEPSDVILEKILRGDKSDFIPPVWEWKSESGDRTFKISETMMSKIKDILYEKYDVIDFLELYTDENYQIIFKDIVQSVIKKDINTSEFLFNLKRNIQLITLDDKIIPDYIMHTFNEVLLTDDVNKICENFDRINLLENTKYAKQLNIVANIFDDNIPIEKIRIIQNKKLF